MEQTLRDVGEANVGTGRWTIALISLLTPTRTKHSVLYHRFHA